MRRRIALCAAALAAATALVGAAQANGAPVVKGFSPIAAEQAFTVPNGVHSIRIQATGGRGGNSGTSGNVKYGGLPHARIATFPVTPGQVLYVEVGGIGGVGTASNGGAGGFNGGGAGGRSAAGGGGGASDVRTISMNQAGSLGSRLIVAAGGGGGASGDGTCTGPSACAGNGGWAGSVGSNGLAGATCVAGQGGGPGTLSQGGAGGAGGRRDGNQANRGDAGVLGFGGRGGWNDFGAGGGGGGYYGGGGGGAGRLFTDPPCFAWPGGGGGGSSFVASWATGVSGPTHNTHGPGVVITYDAPPPPPPPPPVSNEFTFGKPKLNKRKGTAKLPVRLPGAGELRLVASKNVKGATAETTGAGAVKLAVRPRGKARKKLRRLGKAALKVTATYAPTGGEAKTKTKKLTLRMKR